MSISSPIGVNEHSPQARFSIEEGGPRMIGQVGLADFHRGRRAMAQKSLLQMLDEIASRGESLEREKSEAVARAQALEREAGELRSLISLAEAKVDEILKVGATASIS